MKNRTHINTTNIIKLVSQHKNDNRPHLSPSKVTHFTVLVMNTIDSLVKYKTLSSVDFFILTITTVIFIGIFYPGHSENTNHRYQGYLLTKRTNLNE